jgi:hypothetical protein
VKPLAEVEVPDASVEDKLWLARRVQLEIAMAEGDPRDADRRFFPEARERLAGLLEELRAAGVPQQRLARLPVLPPPTEAGVLIVRYTHDRPGPVRPRNGAKAVKGGSWGGPRWIVCDEVTTE